MSHHPEKRVNIELDDELHKQAKAISVLKGIALSDFVREAIAKAVQDDIVLIANTAKPLRNQKKFDNKEEKKTARK